MSRRHVKKLQEAKLSQEESDHSDNEYEPPCVKESSKSTYEGLILSSSSDEEADSGATALSEKERRAPDEKEEWANDESSNSDHGTTDGPQSGLATSGPSASASKKSENKKKKKKQKSKKAQSSASTSALDEVEQSLSEVNAMLGEPAKQEVAGYVDEEYDEKARLFSIKRKHVNSANELARLFGPETEDLPRKTCRRPNLNRIYKCKIIEKEFKFQKLGLSMSIVHRDSKKTCFVFDHSKEYQKFHTLFVSEVQSRMSNLNTPTELSLKYMHVEGLIEASDVMFRLEDSRVATDIIEQAIAYMQYAALPSFNLLDLRTRLEYKYPENRAFHIMLLKYIHLLSNRACHRTAMELAKVLLNLDESDPLGVVFIIDVVALRAREHEWLLDAITFLELEKMLRHMFNIKFSRALAQFLTSYPDSAERETSDHYIQHALLSYPWFLRLILHYTNYADQSVLAFELYSDFACNTTPQCLKDVIGLYASFTAPQWRDPSVMEWLLQNATSLGKTYAEDHLLRQAARTCGEERIALFPCWPDNMHRHLIIINAMANFLAENGMPSVRSNQGYDPVPPSNSVIRTEEEVVISKMRAEHHEAEHVIASEDDSYDSDCIFLDSDDFSEKEENDQAQVTELPEEEMWYLDEEQVNPTVQTSEDTCLDSGTVKEDDLCEIELNADDE